MSSPISKPKIKPKIWWSNIIFFIGVHIAALVGVYRWPVYTQPSATLCLAFISWQLSCFGSVYHAAVGHPHPHATRCSITIGYHRLYSHKSFRATLPLRIVLAALGAAAHQGSIKVSLLSWWVITANECLQWWCLRHRLHHVRPLIFGFGYVIYHISEVYRWPCSWSVSIILLDQLTWCTNKETYRYAATRGLLYSHVGWIFFKPNYGKLDLIQTDDLDNDPGMQTVSLLTYTQPCFLVVRVQHQYYRPSGIPFAVCRLKQVCLDLFALIFGFCIPAMVGSLWGDAPGGFIWGGLVARVFGEFK